MDEVEQILPAFDLPPDEAIEYLKAKGVIVTSAFDDLLAAAHTRSFTVAGVASADLLQDIQSEIKDALEQGTPFGEFKKRLRAQLGAKGWSSERFETEESDDGTIRYTKVEDVPAWRLELIYRQNLQSSLNAGRYLNQRALADVRPYLQLLAISDNRTTDICKAYNEVIAPVNDPIWSLIYPPNHFMCRSRVRSVSQAQADRMKATIYTSEDLAKLPEPPKGFDVDPLSEAPVNTKKYSSEISSQLKEFITRKIAA